MSTTLADLSLRRELLIARASSERIALREQLDQIDHRTRRVQGVAQFAAGGLGWGGSTPLAAAGSALRFLRARPWIVSAGVALGSRAVHSRVLRWIAAAAVVGAGIWLVRRAVKSGAVPAADRSG